MTIRVLSLDFDGCLFNWDYIRSKEQDVIQSNAAFLAQIKEDNRRFEHVYTFIGSNRQSYATDRENSFRNGTKSCFAEMEKINAYLETTFDPFLLADISDDLPNGASYDRALKSDTREYDGTHSEWVFDKTKITVLYTQMHKIASENRDTEIVFDFYDDRIDILTNLSAFYTKSQDYMPNNITLRLHRYAGTKVNLIATIKGTGEIDDDYRESIDDLHDLIKKEEEARNARELEELRQQLPTDFFSLLKDGDSDKDEDEDESAERELSDSVSPALR